MTLSVDGAPEHWFVFTTFYKPFLYPLSNKIIFLHTSVNIRFRNNIIFLMFDLWSICFFCYHICCYIYIYIWVIFYQCYIFFFIKSCNLEAVSKTRLCDCILVFWDYFENWLGKYFVYYSRVKMDRLLYKEIQIHWFFH